MKQTGNIQARSVSSYESSIPSEGSSYIMTVGSEETIDDDRLGV